jgi:hypothetical protein
LYEVAFVASGLLNVGRNGVEVPVSETVTYYFRVGNNAPSANRENIRILSAGNALHGNVLVDDSDIDGDTYLSQVVTCGRPRVP